MVKIRIFEGLGMEFSLKIVHGNILKEGSIPASMSNRSNETVIYLDQSRVITDMLIDLIKN